VSNSAHPQPPEDFVDPRLEPDFCPELWPQCDGGAVSVPRWEEADVHERRCLEFLAAFYRLNVLNAALLAAQRAEERDEARVILRRLVEATEALETLEDRYAPIGFFGDPVMEGLCYRNIQFVRPALPQIFGASSSASSCFAIPGLEEIPVDERQGTPRVWRRKNG
jgi:hypothetical protein